MADVVVLGAGQAGCQVAASLRSEGFTGSITVVGAESHLPYQRPPLSKSYLTGSSDMVSLWLHPEEWFAENGIELLLSRTAVEIDRSRRSITLDDGLEVPFDTLVLALGGRNRTLPIEGSDLAGVVSLRSLDDADELSRRLPGATSLVVIGGGFIGMEVAAGAVAHGKTVVVLEMAPRLMGRVLSEAMSDFLRDAHRARGLTVRLGVGVTGLVGSGGAVTGVELSDGTIVPADIVLVGVGAAPVTELAEHAGLLVDNGIVVDELGCTSDPRIFAIGDCANAPQGFIDGARLRLESVQNAIEQGRSVASTIAGRDRPFSAVPWFWSDQADLKLQIAGITAGCDTTVVTGDPSGDKFSIYCFADGVLKGVESINSPGDHMLARRLLAARSDLTPAHVRASDFDPKLHAAARATSSSEGRA